MVLDKNKGFPTPAFQGIPLYPEHWADGWKVDFI